MEKIGQEQLIDPEVEKLGIVLGLDEQIKGLVFVKDIPRKPARITASAKQV